ncbi:MAG: hypothetical protein IJE77_14795 [Thermoguttaceae bacterium]|nr:hypothetical protein [Thermoguttaceae bacterium]MBQ9800347.1 hypothetical protein [Thermoguttaceae bacterium]
MQSAYFIGGTPEAEGERKEGKNGGLGKPGETGELGGAALRSRSFVVWRRILILMTKSARVVDERRREPSRPDEVAARCVGLVERF